MARSAVNYRSEVVDRISQRGRNVLRPLVGAVAEVDALVHGEALRRLVIAFEDFRKHLLHVPGECDDFGSPRLSSNVSPPNSRWIRYFPFQLALGAAMTMLATCWASRMMASSFMDIGSIGGRTSSGDFQYRCVHVVCRRRESTPIGSPYGKAPTSAR